MATLTRAERSARPVSRGTRPPRAVRARAQPPPPRAPEQTSLDEIVERWWTALAASESALRAAQRLPGGRGVLDGVRSATAERAEVIRLLQRLEHDVHEQSRLLPWLTRASITNRMLGLPAAVRACIFDLDGVLTASAEVHAAAWAETFDRFLLEQAHLNQRPYVPFDPRHDYDQFVAGRLRLDGVRSFLVSRGTGLPDGGGDDPPGTLTVNGLANRKNQLLRLRLERDGVAAFSGSRAYVEAVRMAGLALAVVSPSANTGSILRYAGLTPFVDVQVDGSAMQSDQLRPKPAPDTLLAACRQLQLSPQNVAVFETTPSGIAAARAAGVGFIVAVHRHGDGDVLRASEADAVVGDLTDLLGLDGV
jgi:HAD superfamily hydrolase (TIGR01509 family)